MSACIAAAVALVCPMRASAQRFDDVGVRAQGMGTAFVAVADDATATWWNPAGLATSLSIADVTAGIAQDGGRTFAVGFPSLGLSYYRLKISEIQPTSPTGTTTSSRQDIGAAGSGLPSVTATLQQFGASFGQSLTQHVVVATTLKLANAVGDTHPDLDVGAMAAFGIVRAGLTVRDLGAPTFGSGSNTFELPRMARAGIAVVAERAGLLDRVVVAVDADLNSTAVAGRDEREVAAGIEAWWFARRLGLRGGVGRNTVGDQDSFGAVGISIAPYSHLNLEGAVTRGSDSERNRWSFDLRLTF